MCALDDLIKLKAYFTIGYNPNEILVIQPWSPACYHKFPDLKIQLETSLAKIIILIISLRVRCLGCKQKRALFLFRCQFCSVSCTLFPKLQQKGGRLRRGERVVAAIPHHCYHTWIRLSKKSALLIRISSHRLSSYRAACINGIFTHYIDLPAEINGWEQIRGAVLIALAPCRR